MPPPLFTLPFPDGINLRPDRSVWKMVCPWYFGFSHHFYFDLLSDDSDVSKRHRFQIKLKPDLSTASLHAINTPEITPLDIEVFFDGYRICEDALVSFWFYNQDGAYHCEVYTESTSARLSNISHRGPAAKILFSSLPDIGLGYVLYPCPASGRFVRLDASNSVAVLDFF